MDTKKNKEIKSLTGIRGIASLYVAVFHFYFYYSRKNPENLISKSYYFHSFFYHGYIGVDLFFILSAFVIALSSTKYFESSITKNGYAEFMQKRWIRIYPAYLIAIVYSYIFVNHFNRTSNFFISLTLLNALFGITSISVHFWSLSAEWITYIVFPIYVKVSSITKSNFWTILLLVFGVTILSFACFYKRHQVLQPFDLSINQGYPSLLRCFGNYFLGLSAYRIFKKYPISIFGTNWFCLFVIVAIFCLLFFPTQDILITILFAFLILSIAYDTNFISKIIGSKVIYFLGVISYPLYLTHVFVIEILEKPSIVSTGINYEIQFILFLIVSFITAHIIASYIEKPIMIFLSKRLKKDEVPVYLKSNV